MIEIRDSVTGIRKQVNPLNKKELSDRELEDYLLDDMIESEFIAYSEPEDD